MWVSAEPADYYAGHARDLSTGRSLSREAEILLQQAFDTSRALDYLVDKVEEAERKLAALGSNKEG
jgi:replicative DNA helicase